MGINRKQHLEKQKQLAGAKLAARLEELKDKGLADKVVQREAVVRKLKAAVHKANYRLAAVAANEKQTADKLQAKQEKAAAKTAPAKPAVKGEKPAPKAKKPKKAAPADSDD